MAEQNWRRLWLLSAGLLGAAAIALGAYAAHGLDGHAQELADKASRFGLLHALALLALAQGIVALSWPIKAAGTLFMVGTLLFCGTLTLLALTDWAVAGVAPFGGSAFILGWLCLALAALRQRKS